MIDQAAPSPSTPTPRPESYARIFARPAGVLLVLAFAWALHARSRPRTEIPAPPPIPRPEPAKLVEVAPPLPAPIPRPRRQPRPAPAAPVLDAAAVARAEAALDQASRERAHADARLHEAEKALQAATLAAANAQAESKSIAARVRDPSARVAAATAKGGFLRGERDKLKKELAAIESVPQTRAKPLMAKSAVAKPTDGAEYHFEVRRDKVSFIDLDRLVDMVKSDARLRIRAGGMRGRIAASVGPVGPFNLRYVLGRGVPDAISELIDNRDASYNLLGWEIVPDSPNRGESYETSRSVSSSYSRAVNRLTPGRDTITMWIYPDGFGLYRKLRDDLHTRGFLVAARPLPEGTSIKGSPSGSLSAGQ